MAGLVGNNPLLVRKGLCDLVPLLFDRCYAQMLPEMKMIDPNGI
jgi:hypothetical protein